MPNSKPNILCMLDLSGAPQAVEDLNAVGRVDLCPPDRQALLDTIDRYDAFWGHVDLKVDQSVLERATRLKVINTASTGTDHIDKTEAARRAIRVLSITRDYQLLDQFPATAECSWMLLLACHRSLRTLSRHVLAGQWDSQQFRGRQLAGRTLGILGVGRLGKMMVEYGKAFRMRVLGCDLKPFDIPGVESVDHQTLYRESDALSIHIHMLPENYHLINADVFAQIKPSAILINTSRGDIIDETALLDALDSGRLAAFGADVLHDEWRDDMSTNPVVRYAQTHDHVIITPHIGGCTSESIWGARIFSGRKLAHYLATGEELTM